MKTHLLAVIVITLSFTTCPNLRGGDERMREFPEFKCRYRLPGKDWSWVDLPAEQKPASNVFVVANKRRTLAIELNCLRGTGKERLDQKFVDGFEKSFLQTGKGQKRDGRFLTFKELPCYQIETILLDNRTGVSRIFLANGFGYTLGLLGGVKPVEEDPDFEKIMDGFEFTEPPVQAVSAPAKTEQPRNISYLMGQVVFFCVVGAVVLRWLTYKRAS